MEEIKVPEVQIWLDNSEDDVLAADPMFAYFKKYGFRRYRRRCGNVTGGKLKLLSRLLP